LNKQEVFKSVVRGHLAIYGATYLYLAMRNKLVLVTDDQKLLRIASKYVRVMKSSELISSL
jgi:predicted nucleic acid-binding protein